MGDFLFPDVGNFKLKLKIIIHRSAVDYRLLSPKKIPQFSFASLGLFEIRQRVRVREEETVGQKPVKSEDGIRG